MTPALKGASIVLTFTDLAWTKFECMVRDRGHEWDIPEQVALNFKPFTTSPEHVESCRWLIGAQPGEFQMLISPFSRTCSAIALVKTGTIREVVSFRGVRQIHKLFEKWRAGNFRVTDWQFVEAMRSARTLVRLGSGRMEGKPQPRDRWKSARP